MFTELSQSLLSWQPPATSSLGKQICSYNRWTYASNVLLAATVGVLACAILGITSNTLGLGVALVSMTIRSFIVTELAKIDPIISLVSKMFAQQNNPLGGGGSYFMGLVRQPLNKEGILHPFGTLEDVLPKSIQNLFT
ncbi:MAG: hypothetical protein E6Q59_07785 [Nitrosomonas sp.]|nr:MAG: hypothetical protein E6Q59_07785 [Nitrosomonas sp.]